MNVFRPVVLSRVPLRNGSRAPRGRGSSFNPRNRFERLHVEPRGEDEDLSDIEHVLALDEPERVETQYLRDASRTVLSRNDSPDVGFDVSINPYRGCEHGCVYCYARPTHEYLGFSSGVDFESRILVKTDAPELLRAELTSKRWKPQVIAMSGVTDCYQPIEKKLELTRGCLDVLREFRNPVGIVTKNHLVTRDADILADMAAWQGASVSISITTLNGHLARKMEPRASGPAHRLHAIHYLAERGIPVGVMVAPVIPGLTDDEIPAILEAAASAGATRANFIVMRLPHAVKDVFADWLERHAPHRKEKVLSRIKHLRGGNLNDPRFGSRMRGEGPFAEQIADLFRISAKRHGLPTEGPPLATQHFQRSSPQLQLFATA